MIVCTLVCVDLYRLEGEEDRESPRSMMKSHESTSRSRKVLCTHTHTHTHKPLVWYYSNV